eukprot:Partr_v1_DN25427_c0_g1_i4_m53602 putative Involved in the first step of pre-mRNA splicing. Required for cell growth and cell cycle control. Plays a role in the levels of the U1, U4, U5 and U6 snRNAs and the maintenance of the U4 U6 snRNA complex. May provide the link between the nineteen complex NTC spliceosome protein complex and the spliceosome through the U6 snRNA. Associates predominantly with U6 snRNAs in assembled active spliceosomes. Binds directly to the internal stem-loop (ISL) domain o
MDALAKHEADLIDSDGAVPLTKLTAAKRAPLKKARVQLTFAAKSAMDRAKPNVGDGSVYNIYYDKWYSEEKAKGQTTARPALTRCDPALDSGLTRAEEKNRDPFFCVFFARGCCGNGYNCGFLHRIPTAEDEKKFERTRDCFGRERLRLDKDDMTGAGSFERDNRTIYVSKVGAYGNRLYDVIRANFEPFGEIESMKCLFSKGIAFVKYKNRLNAEFAKEAMNEQSLENNETLVIRWATEDPNSAIRAASIEESQKEFVESLIENPSKIHTMAFLHDTLDESALNGYYQKENDGSYSEFLVQSRLGRGKEMADKSYIAAPQCLYSEPAQVAPPPPPPRAGPVAKRKTSNGQLAEPVKKKSTALAKLSAYSDS